MVPLGERKGERKDELEDGERTETQRRGQGREKERKRQGRKVIIYPMSSYCSIVRNSLFIWTFQAGQW